MYQLNLSLDKNNFNWFKSVEEPLNLRLKQFCGIMAYKIDSSRINVSIACETNLRSQINKLVKETLIDMFSTISKMDFLKKNLSLPKVSKSQFKILLHTLVAFDRECERQLISSAFSVSNGIAIDGIYNFRLREIKERWLDICRLTEENALYLSDESTFTELIKFLISAIDPKIQKITISDCRDSYSVCGELNKEKVKMNIAKEELLYYLVDLAPMEIVFVGDFYDRSLYNQITMLFDAKHNHSKIGM